MNDSVTSITQNGFPLSNGAQLPNGMGLSDSVGPKLKNPRQKIRQNPQLEIKGRVKRMVRVLLIIGLALILFLLLVESAAASATARYSRARGRSLISVGRIAPQSAADYLAESSPEPVLLPVTGSGDVVPFTYARVVQDNVAVYGHPSEAAQGLPPKRSLGVGYVWVSVQGKATYDGQDYYQINAGEYVAAESLAFYQPSSFQGVALNQQPQGPFAWILTSVQPSRTPAGETNAEASIYQRYQLVQILATEQLSDQVWYQIAEDEWINQITVGKVTSSAPPEGVAPGEKWIQVDLFEQTLAAYEGERMVYATLVSSGLPGWDTPTGLNRVWLKVAAGKMSGGEGRPDYYFLEDVPWTMYFNKDVALHTAYWHDRFGYKHSHGCVNLAPLDARWLFQWAPEDVWVWVQS